MAYPAPQRGGRSVDAALGAEALALSLDGPCAYDSTVRLLRGGGHSAFARPNP